MGPTLISRRSSLCLVRPKSCDFFLIQSKGKPATKILGERNYRYLPREVWVQPIITFVEQNTPEGSRPHIIPKILNSQDESNSLANHSKIKQDLYAFSIRNPSSFLSFKLTFPLTSNTNRYLLTNTAKTKIQPPKNTKNLFRSILFTSL